MYVFVTHLWIARVNCPNSVKVTIVTSQAREAYNSDLLKGS